MVGLNHESVDQVPLEVRAMYDLLSPGSTLPEDLKYTEAQLLGLITHSIKYYVNMPRSARPIAVRTVAAGLAERARPGIIEAVGMEEAALLEFDALNQESNPPDESPILGWE